MKLQQLIQAAQFKIVEGSEHLWGCFGENARYLDFLSSDSESDLSIVFDAVDQEVYQATLNVNENYFIWTNPSFYDNYITECKERKINPLIVYDDQFYTEVTSFENFVTKVLDGFK